MRRRQAVAVPRHLRAAYLRSTDNRAAWRCKLDDVLSSRRAEQSAIWRRELERAFTGRRS